MCKAGRVKYVNPWPKEVVAKAKCIIAYSIRGIYETLFRAVSTPNSNYPQSFCLPFHAFMIMIINITSIKLALYNCTSLFSKRTSSPGLNAGMPMYGQPSHLKASPSEQLPHDPTLPWTVKSISAKSSESSFSALSLVSASSRLALSSAAIFSARPHVQSLQARRRLPTLGIHSGATVVISKC